jgi:hypothetical protein
MAYTDYTLERVQQTFGVSAVPRPLFAGVKPVGATPWLVETLRLGRSLAPASEKARGEFIVTPVLLTARGLLGETFVIYSGVSLNVDPERGLKGECDYILSRSPTVLVLQAPLMIILEAKKNDIEEGLGQCAAQMVAARLFNERHKTLIDPVFGCVTTGETWQFLQLQEDQLLLDTNRYFINQVDSILGILTTIMSSPPQQSASDAA